MQLSPEQLSANGYRFQSVIRFESINQFVQERLQQGGAWLRLYWLCVVLSVLSLSFVLWRQEDVSVGMLMAGIGLGLAGFIVLLLPVHEAVHGIFYKWLGAPSISFHADWNRLFFFAAADRFVLNKREFLSVAVAPFVLLTAALTAGIFLTTGMWQIAVAAGLVLHTGGCIGDFTLIAYSLSLGDDFCSYDDLGKQETLFYVK
jgi:hypothetical protein